MLLELLWHWRSVEYLESHFMDLVGFSWLNTFINKIIFACGRTPTDEHVDDKIFVLREEDDQQGV